MKTISNGFEIVKAYVEKFTIDENIERNDVEHIKVHSTLTYPFAISDEDAIEQELSRKQGAKYTRENKENERKRRKRDIKVQEVQTLDIENEYDGFHESQCKEEGKLSDRTSTSENNIRLTSSPIPNNFSSSSTTENNRPPSPPVDNDPLHDPIPRLQL